MLATKNETFEGKRVAISGFGNVAWGAASKVTELGGKVVTISGPDGYIYDSEGISGEKIAYMLELRATNDDIVAPYALEFESGEFVQGKRPWEVKVDIALPCATQNELDKSNADDLVKNGCMCLCEGANMPCTPEAIEAFQSNGLLYAPGKAANAGGVATSGLEMAQNSMKINWSAAEVEAKLQHIMINIHASCVEHGTNEDGYVDYVKGANIAGFLKVANSMVDQGLI
jgi:glutamate dehydrogenase (NADP+)